MAGGGLPSGGVSTATSPARLGIWDALLSRVEAVGWLRDGAVIPDAVEVLMLLRRGPDPEAALQRLLGLLEAAPGLAERVVATPELGRTAAALCGASRALTRTLREHPEWLDDAAAGMAGPVGDAPADAIGLRRFVRRWLLRIAAADLLGHADMPEVGRRLADVADASSTAALSLAHHQVATRPEHRDLGPIPFTVVAMGKWGGQELNYASDIDVLFVYDVPPGTDGDRAAVYANHVAAAYRDALGGVTPEGVAFRVDPDLRPEGKAGPLARSLDAFRAYYDRWAEPWEFQALIKARPAAGDPDLGAAFLDLIEPYVYPETLPPDTIRHVRTMKARIERERIDPEEDPRFHMKLGPGGLADVEFAAQFLQLVHGGRQRQLRRRGTLDAVDALEREGVLSPAEAAVLRDAYRFCGRVRNRLYLQAGRSRDSLPGDPEEVTRLALSLGYDSHPSTTLREEYRRRARRARRVVERRLYGLER